MKKLKFLESCTVVNSISLSVVRGVVRLSGKKISLYTDFLNFYKNNIKIREMLSVLLCYLYIIAIVITV